MVAILGRSEAANCANFLAGMLSSVVDKLNQFSAKPSSGALQASVLEEINWLVLVSGFFLADDFKDKEDAQTGTSKKMEARVPNELLACSAAMSANDDPILKVTQLIFTIQEFENALLGSGNVRLSLIASYDLR